MLRKGLMSKLLAFGILVTPCCGFVVGPVAFASKYINNDALLTELIERTQVESAGELTENVGTVPEKHVKFTPETLKYAQNSFLRKMEKKQNKQKAQIEKYGYEYEDEYEYEEEENSSNDSICPICLVQ